MVIPEGISLFFSLAGFFYLAITITNISTSIIYKLKHKKWQMSKSDMENEILIKRIKFLEDELICSKKENTSIVEYLLKGE